MNVRRLSSLALAFAGAFATGCASQPLGSGGPAGLPPAAVAAASPLSGLVVIPDYNGNAISYVAPQTGAVRYTLGGTSTRLAYPSAVAVDNKRNTYVLGHYDTKAGGEAYEILVYDAQAPLRAHPRPVRVIAGSHTGLSSGALAVDPGGNVYLTEQTPANAVLVFAPDARGNVAPVRTIAGASTQLAQTQGIVVGRDRKIRVCTYNGVLTFAASANGDVAPIATLDAPSAAHLTGLSVDSHGELIVADYNGKVYAFAATASGSAAPLWTLAGNRTRLAAVYSAVADTNGYVYASAVNASVAHVGIYPPGGGNAAAVKRLTFSFPVFQMALMP